MAGNRPGDNSGNILVDFDYNNIIVVDPNKTIDAFGNIAERLVDHENLVMFANLEAEVVPRTKLSVGGSPEVEAKPGGRTGEGFWFHRVYCGGSSLMNQSSSFLRAQGVLRRKVRLDLTVGLNWKHRTGMRRPISLQPCRWTSWLRMFSSVMPCKGSRGWRFIGKRLRTKHKAGGGS